MENRDADAERPAYIADIVMDLRDRDAVFAVRTVVFVQEQAVPPEEELDSLDLTALHFLLRDAALPAGHPRAIVGAARLIRKPDGLGKVGRVAVLREHRGRGAGAMLMRFIEETARSRGFLRLALDAQLHAIPFYEKLGYVAEGGVFLDAGIEHRHMQKALDPLHS